MKIFHFILIISIILSISKKSRSSCSSSEDVDCASLESDDNANSPPTDNMSEENHTVLNYRGKLRQLFAIEVAFQDAWKNVVCSPVSALLPLGKLAFGAEGNTQKELFDMVGVNGTEQLSSSFKKLINNLKYLSGVRLDVASKIYVAKKAKVKKAFLNATKDVFNSGVEKISFKDPQQACDQINGWVSKQTQGMIPLLLDPDQLSPNSSMVIVNAVYLKGKWEHPFTKVADGVFFTSSGQKEVQMMSRRSQYMYGNSEILKAQIIEIPYEGMKASFIIVLPSDKNGLLALINQLKLSPDLLNDALKTLERTSVDLSIPKFSITMSLDLLNMYELIGIQHMFKVKSGLTGIESNRELSISCAVQKTVLNVHESGTEAAAASAVNIVYLSAHVGGAIFRADHPFLFYIQTGTEQLFSGIFIDPQ